MDKVEIMAALETALDKLMREEEHLVGGPGSTLDLRSIKDEQMIAEIHTREGKIVFFHFYDRVSHDEQERAQKHRNHMFSEPDWARMQSPQTPPK